MRKAKWDFILVGILIIISALTVAGIAMYAGIGWDPDSGSFVFESDRTMTDRDSIPPPDPATQHQQAEPGLSPYPVTQVDPDAPGSMGEGKDITIDELETLADLEGLQNFSDSTYLGEQKGLRSPRLLGYGIEQTLDASNDGAIVRDIEEADLVKVVGDHLFVLNSYRGLIIFDLSDPDRPVVLGTAPILGNPVEMYVVGNKAYAIVSTDYGYWYSWSRWLPQLDVEPMFDMWWGGPVRYQIGSQLVIIDLTDLTSPHVMTEVPIEGFVTDSRRVGDVIYLVSSCHSWYNMYADTEMEDRTYVMSLNIADTDNIHRKDEVSFPGISNIIHVTVDHLYVSQWDRRWGSEGTSNITLVDISDPKGDIISKDTFSVDGRVMDRYQLDEYDDVLRVVSTFQGRNQISELWTFDVSNPWSVRQMGHLQIDDAGNLMATRFEGTRGYTIHLPRSIDPLDVLDLSDPYNPKLCDVFEMPGWVTHMEVRGMKIIAIGVDDSDGERNVAVSLFDVTDPWNVVMEQRVRLGGEHASSNANWDPKALTVLDDQNIVLVPYYSYRENDDGNWESVYAVQVVGFNLREGKLTLGGSFEQPDQVTRTRSVNGRVVATSTRFLQVADISDIHKPKVKSTVELCPNVVDYREFDGYYVELVREYSTGHLRYRAFKEGAIDLNPPVCDVLIAKSWARWFWQGDHLYVFWTKETQLGSWMGMVSKVFIGTPYHPLMWDYSFPLTGDPSDYPYNERPSSNNYRYNYDYYYSYYPYQDTSDVIDNPVLLDGSRLAYYTMGRLYVLDLNDQAHILLQSNTAVELEGYIGLMAGGDTVYLVGYEYERVKYYYGEGTYDYTYHRYYHYSLLPVDLTSDLYPTVGEQVQIPGAPKGVSADGEYVYTTCNWYGEGYDGTTATLNIVRMGDGVATTEHVLDITGKGVEVIGDQAYITQWGYISQESESGYQYADPYTIVRVLSLPHLEVSGNYVLMGTYTSLCPGDDFLLLMPSGENGLVVMDLSAEEGEAVFGLYDTRTTYLTCHRQGDRIFMVQGNYGVSTLNL